ncbi:hypothetical protein GmRootV118_26040 [Variovorax sp. V118]
MTFDPKECYESRPSLTFAFAARMCRESHPDAIARREHRLKGEAGPSDMPSGDRQGLEPWLAPVGAVRHPPEHPGCYLCYRL